MSKYGLLIGTTSDGKQVPFQVDSDGKLVTTGSGSLVTDFDDNNVYFTEYNNGNSGATKTIDWSAHANKQIVTLTADCTFSFTDPDGSCTVDLILIWDASGGWTPSWPANVKWAAAEPTWTKGANGIGYVALMYSATEDIYIASGENVS